MVQTRHTRKQRTDAAIAYALERRWQQAADENRGLLDEFPDDMEAANRLGKALTELGDLDGAEEAYRKSLAIDGTNVIARRNLARLEELKAQTAKGKRTTSTTRKPRAAASASPSTTPAPAAVVRPHSLIEESGKSSEFPLLNPDIAALQAAAPGDPAEFVPDARGVSVRAMTGAALGHLEPRAGLRLRRLMEGGNKYAVVIRRVTDDGGTIYARETFRSPEQQNEPSFLPPAAAARRRAATRASIRSSPIVRYEAGPDADDDTESDDGGWAPRRSGASTDDDEMEDAGFGDAGLDDDDEVEGLVADDDDEPMADDEDES